ncbi:MAG: sugar-transfer associated ATP-grasp domain-containing protein [Bacilli bacterium]|nr:sugar-transfer associated ATP-grasp domain-containing protein [Bacilli bacterium]
MNKILSYIKRLKEISKKYNKSLIWLLFHMLYWYIRIGATLTDYLNYQFYLKSSKDIKTYAVVRTQKKFYAIVSPEKYKKYFTIKPNFLNNFKKYVGREWYVPENGLNKLKSFIKNKEYIMIKPIDGLGGFGVKKIKVSDIKDINEFYNNLLNNRLFIEELIIQNKDMNKLCDKSVNTIRVMTFVNNNEVEILYAGVRIGNGKHAVDNFHSGGMGVAINLKNGRLMGNALDKDLNEYKVHPLSKTKFNNFQIPCWENIISLVKEAALVNTNIKVVGWDVAISENGPIFVEGNRRPGFDLVQVSLRCGRKDIIDNVLKKVK